MTREREKHNVLRARRLRRALNVRCLRSISCIDNFSTVCCGRQMPPVDTCLICVVTRDAKGGEHSAELQELRILPGAHHIGKHFARVRVERMPDTMAGHPELARPFLLRPIRVRRDIFAQGFPV